MKSKKLFIILGCTILYLTGCTTPKQEKSALKYVDEPHSYAKPNQAVITHLDLDINVDFDQEIISGKATYKIENNNSSEIILDTKFLEIEKVKADGNDTEFLLGDFNEQLGQPLKISIKEETKSITVYYKTTDKTEAWNDNDLLVEMRMWDEEKSKLKSLLWTRFIHFDLKTNKRIDHNEYLVNTFKEFENPLRENITFEQRLINIKGKKYSEV